MIPRIASRQATFANHAHAYYHFSSTHSIQCHQEIDAKAARKKKRFDWSRLSSLLILLFDNPPSPRKRFLY